MLQYIHINNSVTRLHCFTIRIKQCSACIALTWHNCCNKYMDNDFDSQVDKENIFIFGKT